MGFHQPPHIHVRTDLRGIDAGMPQNDLNYSQVNSSFQEVRGKGMAKCVWAHIVLDSSFQACFLQDLPKVHAGKLFAITVKKEIVILLILQQNGAMDLQIHIQQGIKGTKIRHITLFAAMPRSTFR
jgi:hypothetical protein